jgi:hypothetical protein
MGGSFCIQRGLRARATNNNQNKAATTKGALRVVLLAGGINVMPWWTTPEPFLMVAVGRQMGD